MERGWRSGEGHDRGIVDAAFEAVGAAPAWALGNHDNPRVRARVVEVASDGLGEGEPFPGELAPRQGVLLRR